MSRSKNDRKRAEGEKGEPFIPDSWLTSEARFPADDFEQPLVQHGRRGLRDARKVLPTAALQQVT